MALEFENASLLSYDYQNNLLADYFVLNSTKNISIKGYVASGIGVKDGIRVSAGNADASGVFETYSKIDEMIHAGHDFWDEEITINGITLGKGRITSMSFPSENPVLFGEYEVSLEVREESDFSNYVYAGEMPTSRHPYGHLFDALGKGVNGYKPSKYINSLSDSYSLSVADNGALDSSHDVSIDIISGESTADLNNEIVPAIRLVAKSIFNGDDWLNKNFLFSGGWSRQDTYDKNNKESFFKEDLDLINLNFSFSKKTTSLGVDEGYYTSSLTHTMQRENNGIVTLTENGQVKGNVTPSFVYAKSGADVQIEGSYKRCQDIFSKWGGGGNAEDLKTKPIEIGRQFDSGRGTVSYNVNYTNNPRIDTSHIHEYTQQLSIDDAGVTSVTVNGTLRPYDNKADIHSLNFDKPYLTGVRLYSGIEDGVQAKADTFYGDSISSNLSSGVGGMSITSLGDITLWQSGDGGDNISYDLNRLNLISKDVSFPGYGGAVTYTHNYSDDPTIINFQGIKKLDISVNDTSPVIKHSPYLIPEKGELVHYGVIPQTELGSRNVSLNAVKERKPNSDLSDWENLPNIDNEISFLVNNAYGRIIELPKDINIKINDAFISELNYNFSSEGDISLNMTAQYSAARSINTIERPYEL